MVDLSHEPASSPSFNVKREEQVMAPMRDGVRLAVDVFRPDAPGKFPVLVTLGPWSKEMASDLQWVMPPQPPTTRAWHAPIEAGDTRTIVSRGYIHILAQIRGVGHSEGKYTVDYGWSGKDTDAYDIIEWAAALPWSDGNVGMIGISSFAATQLFTALQQPPHLKAIFPYDSPGDMYRDGRYDGGLFSTFVLGLARNWAISAWDTEKREEQKKKADEIWQSTVQGKPDPLGHHIVRDVMMYPEYYNILVHPQVNPWFFELLVRPFDDDYYRRGSFSEYYDKITIPIYTGAGWYAWTYTHLAGAFRTWEGVTKSKAKKMIIGPGLHGPGQRWYHLDRPFHQYHDEMLRWYDHWLKGIDTGMTEEPPIKLFVNGVNRWRYENEWPLARTAWRKFYPHTHGRLSEDEPSPNETLPDVFSQGPLTTTNEVSRVQYQTAPLSRDVEVTGPVALDLQASFEVEDSSWVDTNWIVSLSDVFPDGNEIEVTKGWLKASHRALDPSRSKPYRPYHPHTKESIENIQQGKIYEYAIEFRPASNVFRAGHRIRLKVMSMDMPGPAIFIQAHLCRNDLVVHKVYHSREHMTHLLLPVIENTGPSQWLSEERAKALPRPEPL